MRRPFNSIVACAILLASLGASPAFSQNDPFEAAENVPAGIHYVTAGGAWQQGSEEGFYRAVVVTGGVEHVSHRLFIQWLRINAETQGYELVRTVNVKELNLGHGHVLDVRPASAKIGQFRIDVSARKRGGGVKKFAVTLEDDGTYQIEAR